MAEIRPTAKSTITTFANPTTDDFALVCIDAGDKKMLWSKVKEYILGGKTVGDTGAGDIVDIDSAQTLTNKTLTSPFVNEAVALTASATELNVLDGIPAGLTSTEVGYLDGVTSAIQTQLNNLDPRYAEIYITGGSTAQDVVKTTWTALVFSGAGGANGEYSTGLTPDKANNKITVSTDGVYLVQAKITFDSEIDALTHQFAISRDGATSILNNTKIASYVALKDNQNTVMLYGLYKEGAQPKDYTLSYYHNHSTNNEITIYEASLTITRISD